MNQDQIKNQIDQLYEELQKEVVRGNFILNPRVGQLTSEISRLQSLCKHEFVDKICVYCDKVED